MKRKEKISIKEVATQIASLETQAQMTKGDHKMLEQMDALVSSLSLEDMLKLDEYILEHNLVDKQKNL